jgi:hypothetical protein
MSKEKPLGRITYKRLVDSLLQVVKDQHVRIAQLEDDREWLVETLEGIEKKRREGDVVI